jgi:hypothetical protein
MFVRVMFFIDGWRPLLASEKQKSAFNKLNIKSPLIDNGYIDIDTHEDPTYLHLLLHSDLVEVFDGLYKIKNRQFRAMAPYALWIELGEKVPPFGDKVINPPSPIGKSGINKTNENDY